MAQGRNGFIRFPAGVNHVLPQGTDNAIMTRVDLADFITVSASGFNDTAGAGINDRCNSAGLCIEGIFFRHGFPRWTAIFSSGESYWKALGISFFMVALQYRLRLDLQGN